MDPRTGLDADGQSNVMCVVCITLIQCSPYGSWDILQEMSEL